MSRLPRSVPYGAEAIYVRASEPSLRTTLETMRAAFSGADVFAGADAVAVFGVEPTPAALARADLAEPPKPLGAPSASTTHTISVVYDGEDLAAIAEASGLVVDAVVALHSEAVYRVEVLGFLPGFAYLGGLPPKLVLPRRSNPRTVVPAGAVGIAGPFSGIYPFASPGGWHLVGRAIAPSLFDAHRDPPNRFRVGDQVHFRAASHRSPPAPKSSNRTADMDGALTVEFAAPGTTIQDHGRAGRYAQGLAPSGPLDSETFASANAAVGNGPHHAAIEIPLHRFQARAEEDTWVSVDGERARLIRAGESIRVAPSSAAVRYLAVQGGIDVPAVLGSRSTLLVAQLGGYRGRMLRRGDRLPVGGVKAAVGSPATFGSGALCVETHADALRPLDVVMGPHLDAFSARAVESLLTDSFAISRFGNRVGVRLEGSLQRVGADAGTPTPMVRGAIQVATDGTPMVLGPDHAVTGGYPVIGVLTPDSIARFARRRPGERVRFNSSRGR